MNGMLYICATPIGNLEDMTLRALRILRDCDAVACEDTRHTAVLLQHYEISKPLLSYHEHNEQVRSEELLHRVAQGERIVLVSDAGMPCISDPGYIVVSKARQQGLPVTVLPGACAGITALALSGQKCDRFVFEGFLPRENRERRERIEALKTERRTVILHESPHHLEKTLQELFAALGERTVTVAREMTKVHEECVSFPLSQWQESLGQIRGEFVLLLSGAPEIKEELPPARELVAGLMASGMDKKSATKAAAQKLGVPKNEVYMQVQDL